MLRTQSKLDFNSPRLRQLLALSAVFAAITALLMWMNPGTSDGASSGENPGKIASAEADSVQRPSAQTLIWGVPRKTCIAYGGKYDNSSGLSEWSPELVLKDRSVDSISGTLIFGEKELQFGSRTKKLDNVNSTIQSFSLRLNDDRFFLRVFRIDEERVEIKIGGFLPEATYIYSPSEENKGEFKLIKGKKFTLERMFKESDILLLLPLLSYKLGVEMGLTGNIYPAALAIHRFALSIAEVKDIRLMTIRGKRLFPAGRSDAGGGSSGGSSAGGGSSSSSACAGRMPGTRSAVCYGMCGPECTCWEQVCGDCCCHSPCLSHDAYCACTTMIACTVTSITVKLSCASSCNNPGSLPRCSGGTGSGCPSGQFFCSHTRSCLNNGARCQPTCELDENYCERLQRCMPKTQCASPRCSSTSNCSRDQICHDGECVDT
jgi:hypothetical protein